MAKFVHNQRANKKLVHLIQRCLVRYSKPQAIIFISNCAVDRPFVNETKVPRCIGWLRESLWQVA